MPQELTTDAFETVWATVTFSRGLFGKPPDPAHIEQVLRDAVAVGQEGQHADGAVRRHEAPRADREGAVARARRSCSSTSRPRASTSNCARTCGRWCARSRDNGVTIILTTHYIEEAEEMADRIGVISKGEIILVEEKAELMRKLGKKQLDRCTCRRRSTRMPAVLAPTDSSIGADGHELVYTYDTQARAHRHHRAAAAICGGGDHASRTCRRSKARSRTFSSAW